MSVRPIVLVSLFVVMGSGPASGSNTPPPPIATDRPAVTASSVVVPPGSVQAENGFAETASQGQHTVDGPETLLRWGVASKTELRLTAPDYFGQIEGSPGSSGFGDVEIGMKQQLGPAHGFDVSLIVSLSLPSGAAAISSHGDDPSVQLPWS